MNAYLFLAEGFEEIEALATVDILRRAEISVFTVSIINDLKVKGKNGVEVKADILFENLDLQGADMLILPGGPGVSLLHKHEELKNLIKEYNNAGKWIAAICAAPTVLGKLGILEGKKATCYPGCEADLKGALLQNEEVVLDGNIITSKGPGTTFSFAFKIIEVLKGKEKVKEISNGMCYKY
ncbi:DJ-1 family glyoxalase III [Defluviitalea phaphyphila]|uniref:DJ-1 family glyoxalase III n=1 Tax=Defluviitalea phaphyphila TaxID=1473580 RepID=UPI000730311D|nr:DJ-1 family glyoxalase III [Defluviitalea phaphyphila]